MTMEVPEGVQAFNLWALWIMARLWEEFPRLVYFNTTPTVVRATSNPALAGDPIGPEGPEQVQLFAHSLSWFINEGFVTGRTNGAGAFANVRLTTRGFSVLNLAPRSLAGRPAGEADKSLGDQIREAVKKHAVDAAATLIQKLLLPHSDGP